MFEILATIILIILIILNFKKTVVFFVKIWNFFGNNYNNAYPAFSRFEIGGTQNGLKLNKSGKNDMRREL
jgi:hypothetical protein